VQPLRRGKGGAQVGQVAAAFGAAEAARDEDAVGVVDLVLEDGGVVPSASISDARKSGHHLG
jgi:hypothetical protein